MSERRRCRKINKERVNVESQFKLSETESRKNNRMKMKMQIEFYLICVCVCVFLFLFWFFWLLVRLMANHFMLLARIFIEIENWPDFFFFFVVVHFTASWFLLALLNAMLIFHIGYYFALGRCLCHSSLRLNLNNNPTSTVDIYTSKITMKRVRDWES